MCDYLIFYNVEEKEGESTTALIHEILEKRLDIENASTKVIIDRSHRMGRKLSASSKPRPIVAKFNRYQQREDVRVNAHKLKGTKIGISEQFPEEIAKVRKSLYPELKKAKAQGKKAKLIRDKLIIDGQLFKPTGF
jgi:hypothetical protein